MKKVLLVVLLSTINSSIVLFAQWPARYNGTGNGMDAITGMVADNAGNFYVTGYAFGSASDNDYVTIKYNTNGVQQWLAKYNGPGNGSDVPASVFVDNAGNVYVTGYSDKLTGYFIDNDATTVKYNPQGSQLWAARYDGGIQRNDAGNAIKVDGSGNVFITGYTTVRNGAYTKKDYLTVKYNSGGTQQWFKTYNGPANQDDEAIAIGLDPLGNIYVTGTSFAGKDPLGEQDYLTIKYNTGGTQLWTARYNGPASEPDRATDLAVDNAGNVYVTGYATNVGLDFGTVKYNTNGVQQWAALYNGPGNGGDLAFAIDVDLAGNVYVTGSDQKASNTYNADYLTIKYNSAGVKQWTARFNGTANDNDEANDIVVDKSGNVYVTGWTNGVSPSWDMTTIKYNPGGAQQWVKTYDGPKDSADVGNKIALDANGNVYVAGASTGKTSHWDFTTIKYTPAGAAAREVNDVPAIPQQNLVYSLSQNYPDPFATKTTIRFIVGSDVKTYDQTKLEIFDVAGRRIATPVNSQLNAGSYQAEWDGSRFAAGVYYYKLTSGGFSMVRKMVLTR